MAKVTANRASKGTLGGKNMLNPIPIDKGIINLTKGI
jgi:hypothetical protein